MLLFDLYLFSDLISEVYERNFSSQKEISSYIDENTDCTNQFACFTFICNADGSMTIEGNGQIYNCNWHWDYNHATCDFDINGCDDNSYLWQFNYRWEMTNFDNQNCYFMDSDPHEKCSTMMPHERIMIWTKSELYCFTQEIDSIFSFEL